MATRAEIAQDIRQQFGRTYVSRTDVQRFIGVNEMQAKAHLASVPYITTGAKMCGKRYAARDVAKMIFELQVRA